jgi:hypothetical protein
MESLKMYQGNLTKNRIFTRSNLKKLETLFRPRREAREASCWEIIFVFRLWKPGEETVKRWP